MEQCEKKSEENLVISNDPEPACCCTASCRRFLVLAYLSVSGFLMAAIYDIPGSLESQIEKTFSVQPYEFEYLYSFYSFPNIVLCFFSGIVIDKFLGVNKAAILLTIIALIGQVIITIGAFVNVYSVMVFGRLLYGSGAESLAIASLYYCIQWFAGKELCFVFGFFQSLSRLGSFFVYFVALPLYKTTENIETVTDQMGITLSVGIVMEALILIFMVLIGRESRKSGKELGRGGGTQGELNIKDMVRLPLKYWLVTIIQSAFVASVYVFISCSQQLLMKKCHYTAEKANQIGSIFSLVSAFLSPGPGFVIDKLGKELWFTLGGLFISIISQIILAFTTWDPLVPIILFAVANAVLNSCVMPLMPHVVEKYQLGTAVGANSSIINICLTLSGVLAGYLLGIGYMAACILYLGYLTVGFVAALILWYLDRKDNGVLNLSPSLRKDRLTESNRVITDYGSTRE